MLGFFLVMFVFLILSSFLFIPLIAGYTLGRYGDEDEMKQRKGKRVSSCGHSQKNPNAAYFISNESSDHADKQDMSSIEEEIVEPPDFDGESVSDLEELLTPDDSDVISSEDYEEVLEWASERDDVVDYINNLELAS